MWNSINKLIDPNFKSAPSGLRRDSKNKRRGKRPNNKKNKAREEKNLMEKVDKRSSSFRDKPKSFSKDRSDRPLRDGEKKSFGFKGKSSFRDKPKSFSFKDKSNRPSRDGEKKSFGFKGKSSFIDKKNDTKTFKRWRKKSFGFKGKSSFSKKNNSKFWTKIPIILAENIRKYIFRSEKKKALVLRERKNLKVEIADLKTLALKNIVKKELNLKIF